MQVRQKQENVQRNRAKRLLYIHTFLKVLFKSVPLNGNKSFFKKIYEKKCCNLVAYVLHFDKKKVNTTFFAPVSAVFLVIKM